MIVSTHFADSAATTCKFLIRDSQDALDRGPQDFAGGILYRYRRSLDAMTGIFQRSFKDPTREDFRDCDTPLHVLHLIEIFEKSIREFASDSLSSLKTTLSGIRQDATWLIASSQSHCYIVRRRKLILIPGSPLVRWSDLRIKVEGACDEFDRLLPGLSPPMNWKDQSRFKRDQYIDHDTATFTVETVLDHLLSEMLPYCSGQVSASIRRAQELTRLPERYPFSSTPNVISSPGPKIEPGPERE